jgi:hypothetical protein
MKQSVEARENNYRRHFRLVTYIIMSIAAIFYLARPSLGETGAKEVPKLNPPAAAAVVVPSAANAVPSPGICAPIASGLSSTAANGKLVIDKSAIRNQSKERLEQLKKFTVPEYEQFITGNPGGEHYPLLHYVTKTYHAANDCRHVVDIGTRYVASSLALGASGVHVKTFDIPASHERVAAFRGKTEAAWQQELQSNENVHIEFYNLDLLTVPDEDFHRYMATWLIVLDTFHEPYSVPFEREFLSRLVNLKDPFKFRGIMLLDDIHMNEEMERWWKELQDNAAEWGFVAYDLTSVGHFSGTGLLDFSGQVDIVEA